MWLRMCWLAEDLLVYYISMIHSTCMIQCLLIHLGFLSCSDLCPLLLPVWLSLVPHLNEAKRRVWALPGSQQQWVTLFFRLLQSRPDPADTLPCPASSPVSPPLATWQGRQHSLPHGVNPLLNISFLSMLVGQWSDLWSLISFLCDMETPHSYQTVHFTQKPQGTSFIFVKWIC